ncbi:MAG: HEAT repeat domain-containing protein [Candidatus Nanopelagicales bacterium]
MTIGSSRTTDEAVIIYLLGDADPAVRLRAVLEVGETRQEAAAAALVERFGMERDFQIREALTWAALRIPEATLPYVRESLGSPLWLARLQAVHTLSKLASRDDGARLVPLIGDPIDAVAARAYWAAAQVSDPRAITALVGQLSRGDAEHRNSLTVALGMFGPVAVPAIVTALRAEAPAVRRHAADTLAQMGSPGADGAAAALADAVADPDPVVRLAALNALGQLVVPSAWWVIDEATLSDEPRLRHLARRLTERRPSGPQSEPLVTCEGGPAADELVPALALQVRVNRPRYLSRDEVPADVLDRVRRDAQAQAQRQGVPEPVVARFVAGRVEQFIHETVLFEQVSVAHPGVLVKDLLLGRGIRITGFARLAPDVA